MTKRIAPFAILPAVLFFAAGCAVTDYTPWPGHKTQGEAKIFGEVAFAGFDPTLDGSYAYSVQYDHSNVPIGAFPTAGITITSYHNSGFTFVPYGCTPGSAGCNQLPPAFNPDGLVNRSGSLAGEWASYFFIPPWSRDQSWSKYFVAVDPDGDCQFFNNIKHDYSGSSTGPGLALCFNGAQEENGEVVELEDFSSLDDLLGRIWAGTLNGNITLNLTAISFNGTAYSMVSPLSLGMKSNGMAPRTVAVDLSTAAGKELLQAVLNNTVDKAPTQLSLSFSGGLKFSLPRAWKVAFNHAAIRRALGK